MIAPIQTSLWIHTQAAKEIEGFWILIHESSVQIKLRDGHGQMAEHFDAP
jgi:hypothetical protein